MEDDRAKQDDINQPIGSSYPDEPKSPNDNPTSNSQPVTQSKGFSESSYGETQKDTADLPISDPAKNKFSKKLILIIGLILFFLCVAGGIIFMQSIKDSFTDEPKSTFEVQDKQKNN